jgi:hypothetical protein
MATRITRADIENAVYRLNNWGKWKDGDNGYFKVYSANGRYTLDRLVTLDTRNGPRLQWTKVISRPAREMVEYIDAYIDGYRQCEEDSNRGRQANRYERI